MVIHRDTITRHMSRMETILWTLGAIAVGLLGSAYASQLRRLIEYGPRKFIKVWVSQKDIEANLVKYLHDSSYRLILYLGGQCLEVAILIMFASIASWLMEGFGGRHVNPIAAVGGFIFGTLFRNRRILQSLWNYKPTEPGA